MDSEKFEIRKKDHIRCSLLEASQSPASGDWDRVTLLPEALPELDLGEVSVGVHSLGRKWNSPFFVSSMTAGHTGSLSINQVLAEACQSRGWLLGVGSQRRELEDFSAHQEWKTLRRQYPGVLLASNIGLAQLIQTPTAQIQRLVDHTEAVALFVHLNALQECLQLEGTPQFKGGLSAIAELSKALSVPVIVKEVGSGITDATALKLVDAGVAAIDVSGRGGTHWGRVEGLRAPEASPQARAAHTFRDWGISTPKALLQLSAHPSLGVEVWASGGMRDGLQAAKALAMGASRVGLARPFLEKALDGTDSVIALMDQLEYELKISLFCLGVKDISEFRQRKVWLWERE